MKLNIDIKTLADEADDNQEMNLKIISDKEDIDSEEENEVVYDKDIFKFYKKWNTYSAIRRKKDNIIREKIFYIAKKDKNKPLIIIEEEDMKNPELVKNIIKFNEEMEKLAKEINKFTKLDKVSVKRFYMGDVYNRKEDALVINLRHKLKEQEETIPEIYFVNNDTQKLLEVILSKKMKEYNLLKKMAKRLLEYDEYIEDDELEIEKPEKNMEKILKNPELLFNVDKAKEFFEIKEYNKKWIKKINRKFFKVSKKVKEEIDNQIDFDKKFEFIKEKFVQVNKLPDADIDINSINF